MIRKFFIVAILTAVLASACGPSARTATEPPAVAPTETRVPTETQAPTATEAPTESPTVTTTPAPLVPTNSPDCINRASFVADATIPDNSPVGAGTTFTKTWTIQNLGTCIWGPTYTLVHYSEERMGAPASVPLAITYPGQNVDISVALAAPGSLGTHRGNFVIKNPAGLIMSIDNDSRLWVIVTVTDTLASNGGSIPVTGNGSGTPTGVPGTAFGSATPGSTTSGSGFANVTCAFTTDAAKVADTINAINAYRAQNGRSPYPTNEQLTRAAQAHANDMACNKLFVHTGSNGSTVQSRVAASGYLASSVTENVYGSYPPLSGQGAVNWWINDKTDTNHSKNLISTTYTEIGVGYSFYNNFGYYVVVFAAP